MTYRSGVERGLSRQMPGNAAVGADYVANVSRNQSGIVDINEPVNGVRPGAAGIDPEEEIIPAARASTSFQRVLLNQTLEEFDGDYSRSRSGCRSARPTAGAAVLRHSAVGQLRGPW